MDKLYGALENQLIKEEFNLIFFFSEYLSKKYTLVIVLFFLELLIN